MAMVVKNNMTAVNTLNILNKNSSALSKSLQKVSSGMKINSAADDASGYAISERMRVQIRSLDQANQNTQNGSSMMKVAEGAVSSTVEILKTLKEKAINAANDSNTDSDRQTIQKELDQSIDQINDNANVTFNGKYLIDGSKNSKGNATYTVLTNQSLATNTKASDLLTSLKARNGDDLEIVDTDFVTVSYVQAGETKTTTFSAKGATLQDIFTKAEQIDETSKIFADASNASVRESMGVGTAAAADAAIKAADDAAYGSGKTDLASADGGAAKGALDLVVKGLATAIATYNDSATGAKADEKIDISKFGAALKDGNDVAKADLGAGVTTNQAKMDFLKTLSEDKNIEKAYAGNTTIKSAIDAYNTYLTKKNASDNAHTSVVDSAIVGIDGAGDKVTTASGEKGISITANVGGIKGQISGLNISISDSKGNVKKSANAALDAFSETIRAQNESDDNAINLQVGANANQSIKVGLTDMRAEALGLKGADGTTLNISTQNKANAAVNVLDNAIQKALDQQTTIGSVESRLEYTSSNLTTASENVQASESTIRDADMAKEMTAYTKNNVLLQAAQSMLAQANQSSSNVLSLLQ
ncbi:MAG: flagellin [Anaerovibrio sp.]|uniref:flagellin N-terminal helical domain-containing protein n=1 Tax=Anaerovibrio sp. TaxID=1872532 RepID=UPI0026089D36|nr:flagellin [Anaerovibrio sp.]MDD7676893.1 flagellin [Anaerovibrio sp.]MDY2603711.1 flagellin [Anaerovibrio sp.]